MSAVVAANVLLAMLTAYILAYAGIFVLGFGGSRWTSDIAFNYFRAVIGIGLKLMAMTLMIGIGVSILDGYHNSLSENATITELMVVFVVCLVLVILINTVPNVIAGLIPGGGSAGAAGSSFGAGTLVGAAVGAGAMSAGGAGLAVKGAAATSRGASGGVSAIKAAMATAQADQARQAPTVAPAMGGKQSTFSQKMGQGVGTAVSAAGHLRQGISQVRSENRQAAISQTAGGKVADAIKAQFEDKKPEDDE